jgi:hypothetical protein
MPTHPDYSKFVIHFTKEDGPHFANRDIARQTAAERLFSILDSTVLKATKMPWSKIKACCFTECTWSSLLVHSQRYSQFGIGFTKEFLFSNGGGPALYIAPHLFQAQSFHTGEELLPFARELYAFMTPFYPPYSPEQYQDEVPEQFETFVDYTHEREWRVPRNLSFSLNDVEFVIVPSAEEMRRMWDASDEIREGLPEDKWLFMNNYEQIERLWPSRLP